jgi:hypothetical protein
MLLREAQSLLGRPFIINRIGLKLADPYAAEAVAADLEARYRYKAQSWQERSADFLSLLLTRNVIMYTVVSAILLVASFGIYTAVSNSVADKRRDIAILRSMGFSQGDLQMVFVIEGMALAVIGIVLGWALGWGLMNILGSLDFSIGGEVQHIRSTVRRGNMRLRRRRLWRRGCWRRGCRRAKRRGLIRSIFCAVRCDGGGVMGEPVLVARHLRRELPGDPPAVLVADADLAVMPGRFTAIVGPSGCGKSSLLYLLGLIDRPSDGQLLFDGRDLAKMSGMNAPRSGSNISALCFNSTFCCPNSRLWKMSCCRCAGWAACRGARSRRGRAACSPMSGWRKRGGSCPKSCRAGKDSAWRLPALWPTIRALFWAMNPPAIWTASIRARGRAVPPPCP